jgi:OFA family oxalate/formate antiporter-like MFS transporter
MSDGIRPDPVIRANRWSQLWLGMVCMILIANLQYAWTLFVNPMSKAHGWSIGDIQIAFAIFIATETWLTPVAGWVVDNLGPRRGPPITISFGAVTVAFAWVLNAYAGSLEALYIGAAISGTGAGAIYATCVGNAVKWFPDRRGLAVGITAAGFGAGAALTVIPIRMVIDGFGYASAFLWFGLAQGAVLLLIAPIMRAPLPNELPWTAAPKVRQSSRSFTPIEVLRSPVFWLLYVMFVLVSASGLMATAQIAPIAKGLRHEHHDAVPGRQRAERRAGGRQRHERRGAAVLRLGVGPDWSRNHDGNRVLPGGVQLRAAGLFRHLALGVRDCSRR